MHIFMSYRRSDGISYLLPNIKKRIDQRFGSGTAFFDIDDIPLGIDFRDHINKHLDQATLVLAFIGDNWLGELSDGTRRIDDEFDFVRMEIEISLAKNIPVIPIFTNNATNKILSNLPSVMEALKFRNGFDLRSGPSQETQIDGLIQKLTAFSPNQKPTEIQKTVKFDDDQTLTVQIQKKYLREEGSLPVEFKILLGKTYYRSGMVNPGPEASKVLGAHGDSVTVQLGSSGKTIQSKINRTANVNESVRLVGKNSDIADWFQSNFELGDTVNCRVVGPFKIEFYNK